MRAIGVGAVEQICPQPILVAPVSRGEQRVGVLVGVRAGRASHGAPRGSSARTLGWARVDRRADRLFRGIGRGQRQSSAIPFRRESARRDPNSVIVPRRAHGLGEALIIDRRLEHHAFVELGHHVALDLLPRRLALGIGEAAVLLQFGAPGGELAVARSGYWRACLARSMRTRSPVRSSARPPPAAASGEALRIEGEPDVPDCRPSPMHGSACTPCLISAAGGCMFTTSAPPG